MNTQGINTATLSGAAGARRVVAAAALGAAVLIGLAYGTRSTAASAYGNAVANVTLTGMHQLAARAHGQAAASAALEPTVSRAASALGQAVSSGNGAVLRQVAGEAAADATASGLALAADVLGESATGVSASGSAAGHVIHPGAARVLIVAHGQAQSIPIRMTPALGIAGASGFGQATTQTAGEAFTRQDGYARDVGTCTSSVLNERIATIATLGGFDFGASAGSAAAFIRYSAAARGLAGASAQASAVRVTAGQCVAQATCVSVADFVFRTPASAAGQAKAQALSARGSMRHRAQAQASAVAPAWAAPVVVRFARSSGTATANAPAPLALIVRHSQAQGDAQAAAAATARVVRFAGALQQAHSSALAQPLGVARFALAQGHANTHAVGALGVQEVVATAAHTALAQGSAQGVVTQHGQSWAVMGAAGMATAANNPKGQAAGMGTLLSAAHARLLRMASATARGDVVGRAFGISNADVHAPESRAMRAPSEDRTMLAPEEYRLMRVEA